MTASPIELTPSLSREAIYQLALDSDLLDSSLSSIENWMTDYGSSEDSVWAFARAIGLQCYEAGVRAERERCAKLCEIVRESDEPWDGFYAAAIRKG